MESRDTNISVFGNVDWATVLIYLAMVVFGIISIYAASYDFDKASMLSLSEFSGKQFMWLGISLGVAICILLLDHKIFDIYAYPAYIVILLLLFVTIFIAPDIKGSRSWLVFGPVSFQPAEFGKTFTALALAKLFSSYNFSLNKGAKYYAQALAIVFIPILLILGERETGSALIYLSLMFVLYREGMSGLVLFAALIAIVYFVVVAKFTATIILGIPSGELAVYIMIMMVNVGMLWVYCQSFVLGRNVLVGYIAAGLLAALLSLLGVNVNGTIYFISVIVLSLVYVVVFRFHEPVHKIAITIAAALASIALVFTVNIFFNKVLEPHQQMRIKVALGIEEDLRGAGYNVNQAKIAIGSGGLTGNGFLNGTQTKLKYVPEQHTDFIFCTIGEEEGFWGSVLVLFLFTALILRVITIAERQPGTFGRVYAYCVASYMIFHVCINIGMVLGLCPVIGIPLPFFSYGGSALLSFTIMLFILLRIDAARKERESYY